MTLDTPVWEEIGAWLERLEPWFHRAVEDVSTNWIWYLIWSGLFVATFLLLRMLVTRWGNENVTQKTLVLSLLLHSVAGLFSTTVKIAQSTAVESVSDHVPIRRVVMSEARDIPQTTTGDKPIWEKLPEPTPTDVPRLSLPKPKTPAVSVPEKQPVPVEPLELALPNLPPLPSPRPEPPTAVREPQAQPPVRNSQPDPIPEQTAEKRPEVATTAPAQRQPAEALGMPREEPQPAARPARPPESEIDIRAIPLASRTTVADPEASIRRGEPGEQASNPASPTPAAEVPQSMAIAAATPRTLDAATGSTRGSPFARMEQRQPASGGPVPSADAARRSSATNAATAPSTPMFSPRPTSPTTGNDRVAVVIARPEPTAPHRREAVELPETYRLRNLPERKRVAIELGATEESEQAVEQGLRWLAAHQTAEGYWDADGFTALCPPGNSCGGVAALANEPVDPTANLPERQRSGLEADTGLTGLAVLAFLGAGYTHEEGPYADHIDRALRWLIRQQTTDGFLGGRANRYARMYCHGMAAIALGEAYGMTRDPTLRDPLARSIGYIVEMQNVSDGGWRYIKGQQVGDMSMFGWQLMALKSASAAGVVVPRQTASRAIDFLQASGQGKSGGLAGYRQTDQPRPSMTAEALFSRQMLGMKRTNPASQEAVSYLLQNLPRRSEQDLYYWYYGTLAMYQYGGDSWQAWNAALRDHLVRDQRKGGHATGSWDPRAPWGAFGGRVFSTSMSILCLEVYYRFLPLYRFSEPGNTSE